MKIKLPEYVVKEVFCRIVNLPARVSSSHRFIYKGNCPLPTCGDNRQRMFVKDYGDEYMCFCHNCGYSGPFWVLLKDYFPHEGEYLKQYYLESIKSGDAFKQKKKEPLKDRLVYKFDEIDFKLRMYASKNGFSIKQKQEDSQLEKYRRKCIKVFSERKLPKSFLRDLWCFTTGPLSGYCGIPFFAKDGQNIIHWQGRRMWDPVKGSDDEKNNPKYKFLKDVKNGIEIENKPFYGENNINVNKDVYITEGAIDSIFFDNGLATSGATISDSLIREIRNKFPHRVWVPDNIWLDLAGLKLTIKLLELGEKCFVFPFDTKQKDANSYVIENDINKVGDKLVLSDHVYIGKQGLIKLRGIAMKNQFEWPVKKLYNKPYNKKQVPDESWL